MRGIDEVRDVQSNSAMAFKLAATFNYLIDVTISYFMIK